MSHPVVFYTLTNMPSLKVILKSGKLSVITIFFHVCKTAIFEPKAKINFQFASYRYLPSIVLLLLLRKEYTVSLWGSDYYKSYGLRKLVIKFLLLNASNVSIGSMPSKLFLLDNYGNVDVTVLPFLLPQLEEISKYKNQTFSSEKKTILCGTNGSHNQQFDIIIKALMASEYKLVENYKIIFHVSYGLEPDVEKLICNFVETTCLECEVIYSFYSGNDLVKFRNRVDILLQIQKSDQLSAAMIEHLVQNKLVITGSWLPYGELSNSGVKFITVKKDNLLENLIYVLKNLMQCCEKNNMDLSNNKNIILKNYGIKNGKKKWIDFLENN